MTFFSPGSFVAFGERMNAKVRAGAKSAKPIKPLEGENRAMNALVPPINRRGREQHPTIASNGTGYLSEEKTTTLLPECPLNGSSQPTLT